MIAKVIIDIPSSNIDYEYEYLVKTVDESYVSLGQRVIIPFGSNNTPTLGFVSGTALVQEFSGELKEIIEILDVIPLIGEKEFLVARFLKEECLCPMCRILDLMIPDAYRLSKKAYLEAINLSDLNANLVPLFNASSSIPFTDEIKKMNAIIKQEVKKGNLKVVYSLSNKRDLKYEDVFYIKEEPGVGRLSAKQQLLLDFYKVGEAISAPQALMDLGISKNTLLCLEAKGYLRRSERRVVRYDEVYGKWVPEELTIDEEILNSFNDLTHPYLIATSSEENRMDILTKLINKTFSENKTSIVFVPNVMLAKALYARLTKALEIDAILISADLDSGELLDKYLDSITDSAKLIITTAKGIFYPYKNVGLYFAVDEENDNYYNDQSPRYDLHRSLCYLGEVNNALVIFESLAPSITTYSMALKKAGHLKEYKSLKEFNPLVLDRMQNLKAGQKEPISPKSLEELLVRKSLIICGNANFASKLVCTNCGKLKSCEYCQTALNYSKEKDQLSCPVCGRKYAYTPCECGSSDFYFAKEGVEKVAEVVKNKYPDKAIYELRDNLSLDEFEIFNDEIDNYDIVITTATLSKALPKDYFDRVIVLNHDAIINSTAVDAPIKAYQNLVHAKANLKENGTLIIETLDKSNFVIACFIQNSYANLLKESLIILKNMRVEPFYHVNKILIKAPYPDCYKIASAIQNSIQTLKEEYIFIIGPKYEAKEQGVSLIIKHKSQDINKLYKKIYSLYQNQNCLIIFDKYPKYL